VTLSEFFVALWNLPEEWWRQVGVECVRLLPVYLLGLAVGIVEGGLLRRALS
jgi:hypothetical protein